MGGNSYKVRDCMMISARYPQRLSYVHVPEDFCQLVRVESDKSSDGYKV